MGILGSGNRHRRGVPRKVIVVEVLELLSVYDESPAAVDVEALAGGVAANRAAARRRSVAIVETWLVTAGRGPVNVENPAALASVLDPEKVKVVIHLADAYAGDDARMVLDNIARVEVGAVWNVYRV